VEQATHNSQLDLASQKHKTNTGLPNYIAIEGPIGVGKTSLAKQLAHTFNYDTLLENSHQNPFLEHFYKDPARAALPAQLHFLFERAQLLNTLRQADIFQPGLITDFILEKDPLFAEATLEADEFALYQNVYKQTTIETPKPDLVIYLQAPTAVLEERLSMVDPSKGPRFSFDFLSRLNDAYTNFFTTTTLLC
jgi:deoxyguanosine kinase